MQDSKISITSGTHDIALRQRLANIRVLIADRDVRTANLVQRILFSLGIRRMELATHGNQALQMLRSLPFDFMITEWNMHPLNGLDLVREIRSAKDDNRVRRDIPIIMLTANADIAEVKAARDAGISEFVAKPFSARAISDRIVQIIENPRAFIDVPNYSGPCRRRRGNPPPGIIDRRGANAGQQAQSPVWAAASDIINDMVVQQAQLELLRAHSATLEWAREDIVLIQALYLELQKSPGNAKIIRTMEHTSTQIHSQASLHGYKLGGEVSAMLAQYVRTHLPPSPNHLLVIGKHIDAMAVIFNKNIEKNGQGLARELIASLKKLIEKLQ